MASANNVHHNLYPQFIPTNIVDYLCWRFIINLPPQERGDMIRICFHIELAHWYYLDYYCTDGSNRLNPCGIKLFAAHIFQHIPQLREHVTRLDAILDNWREYKKMVPTYGAILLNTDLTYVLLVQSYQNKTWSFPKGKVYENEEPWKCAAREVLEETGYNISQFINQNDYIETLINSQIVGLYIIANVPLQTPFQPLTRHEIKACYWFSLADLPLHKNDMTTQIKMGISPNAFFLVWPFVKKIRCWVAERNFKQNMCGYRWISQNEIQYYQNRHCSRSGAVASVNGNRQLFTPQNTHMAYLSPVLRNITPQSPFEEALFNLEVSRGSIQTRTNFTIYRNILLIRLLLLEPG